LSKKKPVLRKIKRPAYIGLLSYLGDVQGCGTIRVMYPSLLLNHLKIPNVNIYTTFLSNYIHELDFYKQFTFVQFQRAATKNHIDLIKHFKTQVQTKMKIVSVYEIDDLLINIPEWNHASPYYRKYEENTKKLISMCDGVITSTDYLKNIYLNFNKRINVIPNHLSNICFLTDWE